MLWIKAFHLIMAVTWFSGLFYLPRLFVYHAMSDDKISIERFKVMERKLFWGITTPGAVLTLFFGGWLLYDYAWEVYKAAGWFHAKLLLLVLLILYHMACWYYMRQFRENRNRHSHVFYRWFNEVPVLMLVGIMIMAVVRPF